MIYPTFIKIKDIIMNKTEYQKYMGFSSVDVGSRKTLIKEVVRLAKKKGYKTAEFHKMPTKQLKEILKNLKK